MATKTAKTVTVATALAALAGGVLGVGDAGAQTTAQMSSAGPADLDQWVQMGWSAYGDSVINSGGGFLMQDLPEGAQPLAAPQARQALASPLEAKADSTISLTFSPDGRLSYYDGCNSGGASYEVDDRGTVQIGSLVETQRLCDPSTMNKADELKAILRANPAVFQLGPGAIALGAQGKAIEFTRPDAR